MTIKEIWKKFVDDCFTAGGAFMEGCKKVLKSTFELLKTTLIDFVTGVFTWIWEVLKGVCQVAWSFLQVFWAALVAMVKSILNLTYDKIIAWIKHL